MNELELKYGCNPNQKPSRIYMEDGSDLPVTVLNCKQQQGFQQQHLLNTYLLLVRLSDFH